MKIKLINFRVTKLIFRRNKKSLESAKCQFLLHRIDRPVQPMPLETTTSTPLVFDSSLELRIIQSCAETDSDDPIGRFGRAQSSNHSSPTAAASNDCVKLPMVDAWAALEARFVEMGYTSNAVRMALCKFHSSEELESKVRTPVNHTP